jgi:serine protease Do
MEVADLVLPVFAVIVTGWLAGWVGYMNVFQFGSGSRPSLLLDSTTGNVTTGIVTALAGLRDDPHQIQISAPVQLGNSGGPVLDVSGHLIGVVVSKLNAVRGDVPQNVNFAIKASTAANFLDAHGVAYRSATGEKALPIPDIVEQAKGFSAQVLCHG